MSAPHRQVHASGPFLHIGTRRERIPGRGSNDRAGDSVTSHQHDVGRADKERLHRVGCLLWYRGERGRLHRHRGRERYPVDVRSHLRRRGEHAEPESDLKDFPLQAVNIVSDDRDSVTATVDRRCEGL